MSAPAVEEHVLPVAGTSETLREIGRRLRPRSWLAALAFGAMIIAAGAGIAVPVVIGGLVDDVLAEASAADLVAPGVHLLALAAVGALFTVAAELLVARCAEPVVARLREDVLDRALTLESGIVEASGAGDLLARLGDDVKALSDVVRSVLVDFAGAVFTVGLSLVGLAVIDWRFAVAAACAIPVQWWATRRYVAVAPGLYAGIAAAKGAESRQLLDSVGGARTVRALGLEGRHRQLVAERAHRARDLQMAAVRMQTTFGQRLNFAEFIGVLAILFMGYRLVADGGVSPGQATAAALMFIRLFTPINMVLGLVDDVLEAFAGLARLVGVLQTHSEPPRPDGPTPVDATVDVEGLTFAYRSGLAVVDDVDLHVAAGERVAVVGTTGAGKSTLGSLVAGLRSAQSGRVSIGGVPLARLSPRQRRATVALLTQDVHVFRGTLRGDLGLVAPTVPEDGLREALDLVGAGGWVDQLDDGIDTVVGAGGHELTPVQTQQLALARVVLADPAVVVLDEATADADSEGARILELATERATAGRTVILVAHRLSQAARCDRVAVMSEGRVVELGTHAELVAHVGQYATLWEAWSRGTRARRE